MKFLHILTSSFLISGLFFCSCDKAVQTPDDPTQWVAIDDLKREIDPDNYPTAREDKQVGIFYFLWLGCHGYDTPANNNDVVAPTANDTQSPYNNQAAYNASPDNPHFGGGRVMHHWSEPYFGYYLSNDEWVMRRHAQMLATAGVDVIFFDVTNSFTYLPIVERLCNVYEQIRTEGGNTPQIAFILNSNPGPTLEKLYNEFYKPQHHPDLWYYWDDKPLILTPEEAATEEHKAFFTIRRTWFASHNGEEGKWFGDGHNKWTWADYYPQQAGWAESPDKPEQVSICPATHPHTNHGRSHDGTHQPETADWRSGEGIYFAKEIERALEIDPRFVFITGWNEWTAQRQLFPPNMSFANSYQRDGYTTFFVDQFNEEFSRDLEPTRGSFGDNYYYQMVDFIRRYKGITPITTHSKRHTPTIDGNFTDWKRVVAEYKDYRGDTSPRDAIGWGRIGRYTNNSGRNDIISTKVCSDNEKIYFMVECAEPITTPEDFWMTLYLSTGSDRNWEGFDYAINRHKGALERSQGGWNWEKIADIKYHVTGNAMEMEIPLNQIGITSADKFTIDFKWVDNSCRTGDIKECMDKGDSAPDSRFKYRYRFAK